MQKQATLKNFAFLMQQNLNSLKRGLFCPNNCNFDKYFNNSKQNLPTSLSKGMKSLLFGTLEGKDYEQTVVIDTLINVITKTGSISHMGKICYCLRTLVEKTFEKEGEDSLLYSFMDATKAINCAADKNSPRAISAVLSSINLIGNRYPDWLGELSQLSRHIRAAKSPKEIIQICRTCVPVYEEQGHEPNLFFSLKPGG